MVSKKKHLSGREYTDRLRKLFGPPDDTAMAVGRGVTFQITGDCTLRCSYCYEHHKSCNAMKPETGHKIVDYILDLYEDGSGSFINKDTKGIVLDFIGGEPLLEAALIENICDYFFAECWRRKIPLAPFSRIAFATNGQLWFSPDAQHLFKKYHDIMSVTISIDGVKELHDAFRVDPNGVGSFDSAYRAFQDGKKYDWYNSKMTFVPSSIKYIGSSVKMMIAEGCEVVNCNFAYEPMYSLEDAEAIYKELKSLSDWLIDTKSTAYVSILDAELGTPLSPEDDKNYCGGTGNMLAFSPDGKAYPCIRYAPISIGDKKAEEISFGDCFNGTFVTEHQRAIKHDLDSITRTSQSPEKCLTCPVAKGCGWCSGYNYELYGTPNKRYTGICYAHKGRVLAACYSANRRYIEIGDVQPKKVYLPRSEVEEIIGKELSDELFALETEAMEVKACGNSSSREEFGN